MKHIFSLPNKITAARVLLIPFFIYILLAEFPYKEFIAALVFIILASSDALDGYLARKRNEITEVGKIIDPIADKLLISTALIFFIGKGIPAWMAITIIAREWIITGLKLIFVTKGTVISASILGKAKTLTQSIGIVLIILEFSIAIYVMFIAVFFTVVSGLDYLIKFGRLMKDNVKNIPNLITLIRLLLIPVFVLYLFNDNISIAILVFAAITLGDKIDGISARIAKQITHFGSIFDIFTDWTFLIVALLAFIYKGFVSLKFGILLSIPIILIAIIKLYYLKKHKKNLTSIVSKMAVGFGYITILAVLIDFEYKSFFLMASFLIVLITLANFSIKAR